MKHSKLFIASLLTLFLLLMSWRVSCQWSCLSLLFFVFVLALIAHSFFELKIQERLCIRECYFQNDTLFAYILSSRFFVLLFYLVASVLMSVTILTSVLDYGTLFWAYLTLHTLLSLVVYHSILSMSSAIIKPTYHRLFAREWSIRIMTLLMLPLFVYLALDGYAPNYLALSLDQTITNASQSVASSCPIVNSLLGWVKGLDGGLWWLVINSTSHIQNPLAKSGIWLGFLTYNGLAILGINRLIMQIIHLLDIHLTRKNHVA